MKKYLKILGFIIWVICTVIIIDSLFALLSAANTVANIVAVIGIVIYGILSERTKCFTNWKIKKLGK